MPKSAPDPLKMIVDLNQRGRGHVSPYRWMQRRYETLAREFAEKRPDWEKLREGFAELGMRTPTGEPLAAETLRGAWWRVRRDKRLRGSALPEPALKTAAKTITISPHFHNAIDPMQRVRDQMALRSGRKV